MGKSKVKVEAKITNEVTIKDRKGQRGYYEVEVRIGNRWKRIFIGKESGGKES